MSKHVLENSSLCCGCASCVDICPQGSITMVYDVEGFLKPIIDLNKCVQCELCRKVCPILNRTNLKKSYKDEYPMVYAVKNNNIDVMLSSSSGGVFTEIATHVINRGGIVFGAKFNEDWEVVHGYTESLDGLEFFKGSKYVQSKTTGIWKTVRDFLNQNRLVLFSGTPCQIGALCLFLGRDYSNLILIDIICMGVPSPKVFELHIKNLTKKYKSLPKSIKFRNKRYGGFTHSLSILYESGANYSKPQAIEPYMRGFHGRLFLSKSCHNCLFKKEFRDSDITLADYWGLKKKYPEFYDPNGVSMVMINTLKGQEIFNNICRKLTFIETSFEYALQCQKMMTQSCFPHEKREDFFIKFKNGEMKDLAKIINRYIPQSLPIKLKYFIKMTRIYNLIKPFLQKLR